MPSFNASLGQLTRIPSMKMQNISSNVLNVMKSFTRRARGIRFIHFDDSSVRH